MPKQQWTHGRIKGAIHDREMTLTRLAEIKGLNPNTFRAVWSRTHRKAEQAIAEFLNEPVEELFPDRYPIRSSRILSSKYAADATSPKSDEVSNLRSAA